MKPLAKVTRIGAHPTPSAAPPLTLENPHKEGTEQEPKEFRDALGRDSSGQALGRMRKEEGGGYGSRAPRRRGLRNRSFRQIARGPQ